MFATVDLTPSFSVISYGLGSFWKIEKLTLEVSLLFPVEPSLHSSESNQVLSLKIESE